LALVAKEKQSHKENPWKKNKGGEIYVKPHQGEASPNTYTSV